MWILWCWWSADSEGCFPSGFKATPSFTGTVWVEFIFFFCSLPQSRALNRASIPPCLQEVCIIACIIVCEQSPSVPLFETGQWVDNCELTDIKDIPRRSPYYLKEMQTVSCLQYIVHILLGTSDWSKYTLQSYRVSLSKSVCSRFIHENIQLPLASVINLPIAVWQLTNLQKPNKEGAMKQHIRNTTWKMVMFELFVFNSFSKYLLIHLPSH